MSRYGTNSHSPLRSVYAHETARRLRRLENKLLRDCSGHVVCSDREQDELLRRVPEARVAVIENGVDTQHFRPAPRGRERNRIVFVGQMAYHANADAAVWFAKTIWPALRDRFPHLQFAIV